MSSEVKQIVIAVTAGVIAALLADWVRRELTKKDNV